MTHERLEEVGATLNGTRVGAGGVGEALWSMMQKGASEPWQDTLEDLTGSREMDASAIVEYFAPLMAWLEEDNRGRSCGV